MKKFLLIFSGLIVFVVCGILALPFFIDVDQYRPQLESHLNQNVLKNGGKITIGKMGLTVWGTFRVSIAGLKLQDGKSRSIVSVKDAEFVLPWKSILQASPEAVFRMNQPEMEVIQDQTGQMNLIEILGAGGPEAQAPQKTIAQTQKSDLALPAIVTGAQLSIELLDAKLVFQNLKVQPASTLKVSDLDIRLKGASISKPMDLDVQARLNIPGQVDGVLGFKAHVEPQLTPLLVKVSWDLDGSQLKLLAGGSTLKEKGVELSSSGKLTANEAAVIVESAAVKFMNIGLGAQGKIDLDPAGPKLDLTIRSGSIDLAPLSKMAPGTDLVGKLQLEAKLTGPSTALVYSGKLNLDKVAANTEALKKVWKKPLEVDGSIAFSNDKVDPIQLKMTAPSTSILVRGSLRNFLKPDLQLAVTSPGIDLDQWLITPPKAEKTAQAAAAKKAAAESAASAQAADLDAPMAGLKNNAILKAAVGNWVVDIAKITVSGVELSDFSVRSGLKNLEFSVQSFGFKIFGGTFNGSTQVSVAGAKPTYRFSSKWNGLDLKKAASSQMDTFKNTVVGIFSGQAEGSGSSFNKDAAIKNFDMKGRFDTQAARFSSLDVTKMAFDALGKGIDAVGEKIPPLKGKKLNPVAGRETRYQKISADFSMKNGQFSMPNFYAKADPGMGLDIQGATTLGILDESLNADWELIDAHNVTGAAKLSAEVGGVPIQGILTDHGKLRLPVHVGCKMSSPCPDYAKTPLFLVKIALENAKGAAQGHLKNTVQKAAQREVEKKLIQGLGKKLFGR
ncbi:MAG: hypothetical protein JNL01_04745 [Bdellovibrionales bacterium]|nr:hypothetical protein [Bdellovibrionales bacterium]